MPQQNDIILIDTTVMIKARKIDTWNDLAGYFRLESVETCIAEVITPSIDPTASAVSNVPIFRQQFHAIHTVSAMLRANAAIAASDFSALDAGESDLLAYAYSQRRNNTWVLSSQDEAAVRVAFQLGFSRRLISLEEMLIVIGKVRHLENHYTNRWLSNLRTEFELGNMLP